MIKIKVFCHYNLYLAVLEAGYNLAMQAQCQALAARRKHVCVAQTNDILLPLYCSRIMELQYLILGNETIVSFFLFF